MISWSRVSQASQTRNHTGSIFALLNLCIVDFVAQSTVVSSEGYFCGSPCVDKPNMWLKSKSLDPKESGMFYYRQFPIVRAHYSLS